MSTKLLKQFIQHHHHGLAFLAILFTTIILRFFQLPTLFHWTLDEEFWSYLPYNVATGYHLPLIGGHIGGTGLYSGPFFVWAMGAYFLLVHSSPFAIAALVSFVGVLTTVLVYHVFKQSHPPQVALLAMLFYSISTLFTIYDRKYWNASFSPFLALLSIFLIKKFKSAPSYKILLLLAFISSFALHAHFTGLVILLFAAISIFRMSSKKYLATYLLFVLLFHTPLFVFEIRHNFINTQAVLLLLSPSTQESTITPPPFMLVINTFSRGLYMPAQNLRNELTHCQELSSARTLPGVPFRALSFVILIYSIILLKKGNPAAQILWLNILLVFLYYLISPTNFYPGQSAEYYLLPAFPSLALVIASMAVALYKKIPLITLTTVMFLVVINLYTTFNLTHSQSFAFKLQTVQTAISQLGNSPFTLQVIGHPCNLYGYRYLFTYLGHEPVTSYLDPNFLWLYSERLPVTKPEINLLINSDSGRIKLTHVQAETSSSN